MVALAHWVYFLFYLRDADVLAPRLSVEFRRLVRLGSFLACWRRTNVIPIPTSPPSSTVANYRPISKTSILSQAFERLVSVRHGRFMLPIPLITLTGNVWVPPMLQCCASPIHCKLNSRGKGG